MLVATLLSALIACGNNSTSANNTPPPATQSGTVNMILSDASTEDWAVIGVKVLGTSLIPQGGGTPVPVYTAPTPASIINLVQLDQLGEILGNVSVPAGTYTAASLTLGAHPGDVLLTVSADPEPGFAGAPGATIPPSQIQIMGAQGSSGSMTVSVSINFALPLVVTANSSNALNLEFNLSHPAFIVGHVPLGINVPLWAVNFNGPVRHRPVCAIDHLVLRHLYGTVTAVASDNGSITITKD